MKKTGLSHSAARTEASARGRRLTHSTEGRRNNYLLDVIVPTDTKTRKTMIEGSPKSKNTALHNPNTSLNCCYFPKYCSNCS